MRLRALLSTLIVFAASIAHAQEAPKQLSGTLSIGYADLTPWMKSSGLKSYVFATILDEATDRSYQVTIDDNLARQYGGLAAMEGKTVRLNVAANGRATNIVSVTAKRTATAAPVGMPSRMDLAGYGKPEPRATGSRKILALGCSFADGGDLKWDSAEMEPVFMTQPGGIQAFWKEASANQVDFAGSKFLPGFKQMPKAAAFYFPSLTEAKVDSLLQHCVDAHQSEVDASQYDIIVLHTASIPFCCQMGGINQTVKINGVRKRFQWVLAPAPVNAPAFTKSVSITGHEIGHALGMGHTAPENGNTYASLWDIMSAGAAETLGDGSLVIATHPLTGMKDLVGWLPQSRRFVSYGGTSTITLERGALPANNSNYLIAMIPFGTNGQYYTVELRQKAGLDQGIPREGVIINRHDADVGAPASVSGFLLIIDTDGNGNVNDDGAVFTPGETYVDSRNQVSVTVNSITGSSANVTIRSGGGVILEATRLQALTTVVAGGAISKDSITMHIDGPGASEIGWTASADHPSIGQDVRGGQNTWLQVTTPSGSGAGQIRFQRNPAGLAPGQYIDSITVRVPSLSQYWVHTDTLVVTAPANLYVGLSKIVKRDSTNAALLLDSLTVSVTGPGASTARWSASATSGGRVSRLIDTSGTGTARLKFNAGPNVGSAPGWYVDTIIVSLSATPTVRALFIDSIHFVGPVFYSIPVRSHRDSLPAGYMGKRDSIMVNLNSPWSTVGQWTLSLPNSHYDTTQHKNTFIQVENSTDRSLRISTPVYTVNGTGTAYYTRNAGRLKPGVYIDTLLVRGPFPNPTPAVPSHQGEQVIVDTLVVYAAPQQILLSRYSTRDTIPLGLSRSTDSVVVRATGTDSVHFYPVAKRNPWWYYSGDERTFGAGINFAQVRWNRNTEKITAPGTYVDTIVFQTQDGSVKSAPLYDTLVVLPAATLTVSSNLRSAALAQGSNTAQDSVTVGALGTTSASWTARKRKPWTTITTSTGALGGVVRWTRNAQGLAPGIYIDTISVGAPNVVSAALVDSFTVTGTLTVGQVARAAFDVDSVGGVFNMDFAMTLSVNVSALGASLGTYTSLVSWDSTIVKLDSVKQAPGGFPNPTLSARSGDRVTLSATSGTGQTGNVGLATMYYHFSGGGAGRSTVIQPVFSKALASNGADLLGFVVPSSAKAAIANGALRGDVNLDGKITSADALMLVRFLVGIFPPQGSVFTFNPNGDANCSGKTEAIDLQYVLARLVGLPTGTACVGTVR